jgi:parallel beta-helix repeat protein
MIGVTLAAAAIARSALAAEPRKPLFLFVAPDGNDTQSGTLEHPLRTLGRAREAARAAKEGPSPPASITIELRGGVYCMPLTLALARMDSGKQDLPITYKARAGERPILVGGATVTGFTPSDSDPNTWVTDLDPQIFYGQRLKTLYRLTDDGRVERLPAARYPNADPADPVRGGWAFAADPGLDPSPGSVDSLKAFPLHPNDSRAWRRPADGQVVLFVGETHVNSILPIAGHAPRSHQLRLAQALPTPVQPGDRYFVEGLREELDAPGEWYVDTAAARLFVRPPAGVRRPEDLRVVVPTLRSIIAAHAGVGFVAIQGLTFTASEGTAVMMEGTTSCAITGCTVTQVGDEFGAGICLVLGEKNVVKGCDVSHTGAGGIVVAGRNRITVKPGANRIENCHVHHSGRIYKQAAGIAVTGCGDVVARNLIHDCPRMGIMVGGYGQTVEGNLVRATNQETEQSAAIFVAGRDFLSGRGTRVSHNVIEDTGGLRRERSGDWIAGENTWGILLDTYASGVTVTGNIVARASRAGIRIENGQANRVDNNVIVDAGRKAQIEWVRWPDADPRWAEDLREHGWAYDKAVADPDWKSVRGVGVSPSRLRTPDAAANFSNVIQRNVLVWSTRKTPAFAFENVPRSLVSADRNVFWLGSQGSRPLVATEPAWITDATTAGGDTFSHWQSCGCDTHSVLTDPHLVDSGSGIMAPAADTPARSVGFEPIPVASIGPYDDESRATWPLVIAPTESSP